MCLDRSCLLQPVLIDLDLHDIRVRAAIVGPDILLPEAHAIERLRREAAAHLRELLGIRKSAAEPLDLTHLPADIERRADVPERRRLAHAHALAFLEARRHGRMLGGKLRLHRLRRSTSSILRPSSSVVMTPRWMSVCVSELIYFS